MHRRRFIAASAAGLAACTANSGRQDTPVSSAAPAPPDSSRPGAPTSSLPVQDPFTPAQAGWPFAQGVGSGDPTAFGVVLWTRLVSESGQTLSNTDEELAWEVALDPMMSSPVAAGRVTALAADAHAAQIAVEVLEPDTTYFYRFHWRDGSSIVGRTHTLPGPGDRRSIRLAVLCCQHYEDGWFGAYQHVVDDDIDLVVHLGDYVYGRTGSRPALRSQPVHDPTSVSEHRTLWHHIRRDPDLQRAHASVPFVCIWDDHELAVNHAGALMSERVRNAAATWRENQAALLPGAPDGLTIHRRIDLGTVGRLWLLDGRQYRDPQVCDRLEQLPAVDRCEEVTDPERTMLGFRQEQWLADGLSDGDERWQLVAQPTVMADLAVSVGGLTGINNDQWDGYTAARERLLTSARGAGRTVVLSGDLHAAMANCVGGADSGVAELVAPSVTSKMSDSLALGLGVALRSADHVQLFEPNRHGYLVVELASSGVRADFRWVDPDSEAPGIENGPSFDIVPDDPTPRRRP